MADERLYTKAEIDEAKEHASLLGGVTQSLKAFTEEMSHSRETNEAFKRDINQKMEGFEKKLDDGFRDVITRAEVDKKLDKYVTKDSFEPIKKVFYWGLAGILSVVLTLIVGIVTIIKYASQ